MPDPLCKKPNSIIFNADDLGLSPSVNRSILTALSGGVLRSVSLMTGMPEAVSACDALAELRDRTPEFLPGLGLHFCLTSGRAVSSADEIPLLVDHQGRFRLGFLALLKQTCFASSAVRQEILRQITHEFRAQNERFQRLLSERNMVADHIDSHQHIHAIPCLTSLLALEAERTGLVLRIPHENYGSPARFLITGLKRFPGGPAKKIILDCLLARSHRIVQTRSSGYFGILDTGHIDTTTVQSILQVVPRIARRTGLECFEINLHPWNVEPLEFQSENYSPADRKFATSRGRSEEWNAIMTKDSYKPILEKNNLEITSFAEARRNIHPLF